jgi:hypothetical protein
LSAPDPYDPALGSPFDHDAFYVDGEPYQGDVPDTGLRCACGREVVNTLNDPPVRTGWAHVGCGDASDKTGMEVYMPKLQAVG